MNRIYVRGLGAVSPAGWGVAAFREALHRGAPLPARPLASPTGDRPYAVRQVPPASPRPAWMAHPRLRRASALSQFAAAATLEALATRPEPADTDARLGIVAATHTASIRYSERFYHEVLQNPAVASPVLFPETVINAPVSHLAALLGNTGWVYSVIGDQTAFVQALRIAQQWLLDGEVEDCLVVATEETAWSVTHALRFLSRRLVPAEGAGALWLSRSAPTQGVPVLLDSISDSHAYAGAADRSNAVRAMRRQWASGGPTELLVESGCGVPRTDRAETAAWSDWQGPRLCPRHVLGEGLCAGTGWQFVAAVAAVANGSSESAIVSVVGSNQEAVGARVCRDLHESVS